MRSLVVLLCALGLSLGAVAQSTISGVTVDADKQPLPNATAALLLASDSTLVQFTLSDTGGRFAFQRVAPGAYLVQVSYMGFNTLSTPVTASADSPSLPLGNLQLQSNAEQLGAAEVVGEAIPIVFKEDTVEYNADSFKTDANDNVEKLLKQLPGVEVGKDGSIKAHGEDVEKVLVDGKEFFGGDAKIATQNLPADAIDKVQVYDKQSEESEFTGVDDGERQKTINLTLKEDKKKGGFGELMAGGGVPELFDSKVSINRFNNKMQLAGLGMYNNINKQGFGFGDYIDFAGGFNNAFGGGFSFNPDDLPIPVDFGNGTGLSTNLAGGLNLNYDFSSKLKLESSAFYNTTDREVIREVDSEGTTATEDYRYNESTTETGTNENVRGNIKLKWTPDSLNQLIVSGNGRLNDYGETLLSSSANLSAATGDLISGGNSSTTRGSDIFSGTAGVSYTRNAGREGRSLIVTSQYKHYLTDGNDRIYNSFLVPGDPSSPYLTNQRQVRDQVQDELSSSLRYTEPLGKNTYLTARLSHDWRTEQWAKDFFDVLGETSDPEELLNDSLSLAYDYTYQAYRGTMGLRFLKNGWNLFGQFGVQYSTLLGNSSLADDGLVRDFLFPVGAVNAFKKFSGSKKLRFSYRSSVREPSLVELQPTTNNSDPLNTYVGNPNLRPENAHNLSAHYSTYTRFSGISFHVGARTVVTTDPITQSVTFDENLARISSPTNAPLGTSSSVFSSLTLPWQPANIEFDLSGSTSLSERFVYLDGQEDVSTNWNYSAGLEMGIWQEDKFEWEIGYNIDLGTVTYQLNDRADQNYTNHSFYAEISIELGDKWLFETWADYYLWTGDFAAPEQLLLNASIERYFGKDNRFWLSLDGRDLLGQNSGVDRSVGANFVQQTQTNMLTQYVMLRAHWKLSKFGGSKIDVEVD